MNESRPSAPYSHRSAATPSPAAAAASSHTLTAPQPPASDASPSLPTPPAATVRLNLPAINFDLEPEQRADEVIRIAQEAFPQTGKWVLFYREILGTDEAALG